MRYVARPLCGVVSGTVLSFSTPLRSRNTGALARKPSSQVSLALCCRSSNTRAPKLQTGNPDLFLATLTGWVSGSRSHWYVGRPMDLLMGTTTKGNPSAPTPASEGVFGVNAHGVNPHSLSIVRKTLHRQRNSAPIMVASIMAGSLLIRSLMNRLILSSGGPPQSRLKKQKQKSWASTLCRGRAIVRFDTKIAEPQRTAGGCLTCNWRGEKYKTQLCTLVPLCGAQHRSVKAPICYRYTRVKSKL